jgi:hypothetical protein
LDLHFPQMLVNFPQIREHWEKILRTWFAVSAKLVSPLKLFFGVRYVPTDVEVDFVRVMQSIESFHRLTTSVGLFMPQDQYMTEVGQPTIHAIPSLIDPDVKESVAKRIELANELTLRRRLKLIFNSLPHELLTMVKIDNKEAAIDTLVKNRNWYTHFPPDLKQYALESLELWPYEAAIHVILEYLFLKETNVPEKIFLPRLIERRRMLFNQPE